MVETFVQTTDDVVKFLTEQHNLIKDLFEEVLSASGDEAREKAFVDLRQLLAVHETAEEMVVHPRARDELDGGNEIVDARLEEEHAAKQQLQKLESLDIGSKEFIDELKAFQQAVLDHARNEFVSARERLIVDEKNIDVVVIGHGATGAATSAAPKGAARC